MPEELHLEVLGGLRMMRDGVPVAGFVSSKAPALLAYLAVTGRPHFRTVLAGLLWGEWPEADARMNLRHVLSNLRQLVGPHLLITRETVAFNRDAPYWLDVECFEAALHSPEPLGSRPDIGRLREAVELYQGDFLAGFYVREAPEFEEWVAGQRERLRHLALQALHTLAVHATARQEYGAGLEYLTRLLALDPWREEAHRQLMLLLAQSGQRDAALAQYERCRRLLLQELGVEPEEATTALAEQIRADKIVLQVPSPLPAPNLPVLPTPLLGRGEEVAQLAKLLAAPACRLLTLVGAGGIGKTSLAVQAAREGVERFADGVYFVNLAPITDPELVAPTLAQTLGVREAAGEPLLASLQQYLRDKQLLLLLDNFEQVLSAAPLVAELLASCPDLKVLVTSRAVLNVRGEQEVEVLPLAVPPLGQPAIGEQLLQYPAIALFVRRAQAANARFVLTDANAATIAAICRRLDGLPLAIELAAARVKLMSPQALLTRLERCLAVLTGGAHDLPKRQQTLQSTIAWSYDLLEPGLQRLFARLAVFVGGWTLEAAEAVCRLPSAEEVEVLEGVTRLVDKSLVRRAEQPSGEVRLMMLETIREYALERLLRVPSGRGTRSGEAEAVRRQHAAYYLALAEAAEPELEGSEQVMWLDRLAVEHDNLRAALGWLSECGDVESALRLTGALFNFWWVRGFVTEGLERLRDLLARATSNTSPQVRAKALAAAVGLALNQPDLVTAQTFQEELLALHQQLGDPIEIGKSLSDMGRVARESGDFVRARAWFEQSLALYQQVGDRLGIATQIDRLGTLAHALGEASEAARRYEESRAIFHELNYHPFIIWSLHNQGALALTQGDTVTARALLEESLALRWEQGNRLESVGSLALFACLAAAAAQYVRALHLAAAVETLSVAMGTRVPLMERRMLEHWLAVARRALSDDVAVAAWAEGRAMKLEQAIAYALQVGEPA